jgi:hypothetical protein
MDFFNLPNHSSRTMALVVDSASNRIYQESSWGVGKGRLAHRDDNLTTICEPIV